MGCCVQAKNQSTKSSKELHIIKNYSVYEIDDVPKLLKHYEVYQELGSGAYGTVKLVMSKTSKTKRAMKILRKKRMDQYEKESLNREI